MVASPLTPASARPLQLARTLASSAALPEDCDDWDQQQEDEFKNFRMESLYDAMLDVCDMLGAVPALQAASESIKAHVQVGGSQWVHGLVQAAKVTTMMMTVMMMTAVMMDG